MTRRTLLATAATFTAGRGETAAQSREHAKVRFGIVGGGFGSAFQFHLDPHCEVAAVCDIRDDRLQRLREVYRCGAGYKDFRSLLKHPGLNAVGVFTPAPLHAWMTVTAMKAGKHVISAVPAGLSEEELAEILETVKRTGLRYMMAETSYYRPEAIACRELAQQGRFGTIFYSESEYHHEGLLELMFDDRKMPTWRHGFPPMHYPTHCTGLILPVIGERFTKVTAYGWGDGHEVLKTNAYRNPFWNTTALFRTDRGHSSRITVAWHLAAGGTERGAFYGDRMSYVMQRPEGSPNTIFTIGSGQNFRLDENGYPEGKVERQVARENNYWERLPERMRVKTGHGGSHSFLSHEFVRSIVEDRHPSVNIWEAIAYTLPGLVAHRSALRDGETLPVGDYGRAPV